MTTTGCQKCDELQKISGDETMLCSNCRIAYLEQTVRAAVSDYLNESLGRARLSNLLKQIEFKGDKGETR